MRCEEETGRIAGQLYLGYFKKGRRATNLKIFVQITILCFKLSFKKIIMNMHKKYINKCDNPKCSSLIQLKLKKKIKNLALGLHPLSFSPREDLVR